MASWRNNGDTLFFLGGTDGPHNCRCGILALITLDILRETDPQCYL
jgi:hypothetical protein